MFNNLFKKGLQRSKETWFGRVRDLFSRQTLDENLWTELEEILISADVGVSTTEKLIEKARTGIENEKLKALSEIHEQVATLSVDIASKLLGEKLKQTGEQAKLIDNYLKEIDFTKN